MTTEELSRLRAASPRALTHHCYRSPKDMLHELADTMPADLLHDRYGAGSWLEAFEVRIARELGKEAAVFLPTGTMAQQIALRIWCDRAQNRTIAFHPTCHLEIYEARSYSMLHDLRAQLVGSPTRLMTAEDVRAIHDPLAALLVELPQRGIGALLPAWTDLLALCDAARRSRAKLHLDGARLWEAAPYYGRSHAEIAALFDSVYVSFHKGLGAIGGAMLAGDAGFVKQARLWQLRHGGRLFSIAPLALSAQRAFENNLGKMSVYRDRAREIAEGFVGIDGVIPNLPQTNTFHVFLRGKKDELEARAHAYAKKHGIFMFARLAPSVLPDVQKWEFVVGDATLELSVAEIVAAVRAVAEPSVIALPATKALSASRRRRPRIPAPTGSRISPLPAMSTP